jgi:hypothetical protein
MYLHDFQCPKCLSYYNEISPSPVPGQKWCASCNVMCPHDETYFIEGLSQPVQQPVGFQSNMSASQSSPQGTQQQVLAPVSRYNKQIVVKLTNTPNYGPVNDAGTALHNKATSKGLPSEVIELDGKASSVSAEHMEQFRSLTDQSRLYIVGHGHGSTIQGVSALDLAVAVRRTWGVTAARRITLVSCKAGESVENELGNFAKDFHSHLKRFSRIATEVAAYTRPVSVATAAFAIFKGRPNLEGRKAFYRDDSNIDWMANDGDAVKLIWFWENNAQKARNRSQDRSGRK